MSDKNQDGSKCYLLSQFQNITNMDLGPGLGFLGPTYKWELLDSVENKNYRIN